MAADPVAEATPTSEVVVVKVDLLTEPPRWGPARRAPRSPLSESFSWRTTSSRPPPPPPLVASAGSQKASGWGLGRRRQGEGGRGIPFSRPVAGCPVAQAGPGRNFHGSHPRLPPLGNPNPSTRRAGAVERAGDTRRAGGRYARRVGRALREAASRALREVGGRALRGSQTLQGGRARLADAARGGRERT
ncbi:hypothetical protein PR202_gn00364 [Eleusine coracana subsp. coracana]|uniref:Uncharacterized protein n=1 Tax=Eleusine coracana subsp. coracana TaxID=191504 RepID=A0AAV5G3D3_ELECO|nr:hypothetical protein PR202_gn00364 [Eleusine coracana subsp. coracana]